MQFVCSFLHYSVTNLQSQKKKNVTMPKINVRIFTVLISMGRRHVPLRTKYFHMLLVVFINHIALEKNCERLSIYIY